MPLNKNPYNFPELEFITFKGLPGLLMDSLPDKFGNKVIDKWLVMQNRDETSFNPIDRLCFIGNRGMGALEYEPSILDSPSKNSKLEMSKMVGLANKILDQREYSVDSFIKYNNQDNMGDIIWAGTSAGGSRAKAIIAWNEISKEFIPEQLSLPPGFEHWLIKFDGIKNNRDKERTDPMGYGKIEYAYYLMALKAGIKMSECRLYNENERNHFITKRFDRNPNGSKIHMQSLCAIAHMDFNQVGRYSYEDAIHVMNLLHLPQEDLEQFVLRALFNVVGRNQDDHVKNIAFLMSQDSEWRLSPAYDVTYAYDPTGKWTNQHQMSINGKRDNFVKEDFYSLSSCFGINKTHVNELLDRVIQSIKTWPDFAMKVGIDEKYVLQIHATHRLSF